MIVVEIYSKTGCHLCEIAKGHLKRIQQTHPFELREILIHAGDEFYEDYKERIPVIMINNKVAFQHRIIEQDFIDYLMQGE